MVSNHELLIKITYFKPSLKLTIHGTQVHMEMKSKTAFKLISIVKYSYLSSAVLKLHKSKFPQTPSIR
jgi:hypothetical protein